MRHGTSGILLTSVLYAHLGLLLVDIICDDVYVCGERRGAVDTDTFSPRGTRAAGE